LSLAEGVEGFLLALAVPVAEVLAEVREVRASSVFPEQEMALLAEDLAGDTRGEILLLMP